MKTIILLLLVNICTATELKVGLFIHDVDNLWANDSKESGTDICIEYVSDPDYFTLNYVVGVFLNNHNTTNAVYTYLKKDIEFSNFYVSLGMGVSLHDGITKTDEYVKQEIWSYNSNNVILLSHFNDSEKRKQLGSRLLLRIPLEIGYRYKKYSFSVCFTHMSTAYTRKPNEGMDFIGFKIGTQF